MTTDLKEYIQKQLSKGISETIIKESLIKAGHDSYNLSPIFLQVNEELKKETKKRIYKKQLVMVGISILLVIVIVGVSVLLPKAMDKSSIRSSNTPSSSLANSQIKSIPSCITSNSYENPNFQISAIIDGEITFLGKQLCAVTTRDTNTRYFYDNLGNAYIYNASYEPPLKPEYLIVLDSTVPLEQDFRG